MAIIGKGIFGNVSGKIGDVQGSRWKGRDTLQAYNPKGNGVVTPKMLFQRAYFSQLRKISHIVVNNGFSRVWNKKGANLPLYCLFLKFQKRLPDNSVIRSVAYSYLSPQVTESINQRSLSVNTSLLQARFRWWNTNPVSWSGGSTLVGCAVFDFATSAYEIHWGIAVASDAEFYLTSDLFEESKSYTAWLFFHTADKSKISKELGRAGGLLG